MIISENVEFLCQIYYGVICQSKIYKKITSTVLGYHCFYLMKLSKYLSCYFK